MAGSSVWWTEAAVSLASRCRSSHGVSRSHLGRIRDLGYSTGRPSSALASTSLAEVVECVRAKYLQRAEEEANAAPASAQEYRAYRTPPRAGNARARNLSAPL